MIPFYFESPYKQAFLANMAARLRDVINDDCSVMLNNKGVITPVTDVSLIMFIAENNLPSIAEIAKALDYSHQRTAARISALENLDLIARFTDENDYRCKRFSLTQAGKEDFQKLQDVYQSAATVFGQILEEQGVDVMTIMMNIVTSLKRFPVSARILEIDSSTLAENPNEK